MTNRQTGQRIDGPFVALTWDLVRSDAWRSLSINSRRFLDFLFNEHLSKGGQENGRLKAPQKQLKNSGIGARYITSAIREAEERGLVRSHRGGMRVATAYALTWLPIDGMKPTDDWRAFRSAGLRPLRTSKIRNLPSQGKAGLPLKGKADRPKRLPSQGKYLSR
jgi:hypothetical protein